MRKKDKKIYPYFGNNDVEEMYVALTGSRKGDVYKRQVIPIPNNPAINPTINVSALNTLEISFLDAPIALNIPISFVLSSTDIYVIIPIIIDETINDLSLIHISFFHIL